MCPILYRVHYSVGRWLGLLRSTLLQLLIGTTIREFLKTLLCKHWRFCAVCSDTVLSYRTQYVVVVGCLRSLVNMVSGVPQGSDFDPQLLLLLYYK